MQCTTCKQLVRDQPHRAKTATQATVVRQVHNTKAGKQAKGDNEILCLPVRLLILALLFLQHGFNYLAMQLLPECPDADSVGAVHPMGYGQDLGNKS
jgi:hypothetical protein